MPCDHAGPQERRGNLAQRLQPCRTENPAGVLQLWMDGGERRLQLLVGRGQIDGQERDQQDPQRAVQHERRSCVAEEQADAEHDPGNGNRRSGEKTERARARDHAAGRDIGDDERQHGADGRGRGAENHGVLQRELGRRQFGEHEHDVVQRQRCWRHQRRRVRRERGVEQREIRQENRIEQHHETERQRRPAPSLHLDLARRAVLAAQHRIAAAAEYEFLRLQQHDRQQQ